MRESCGVFCVKGPPNSPLITFFGLLALQHRGQDSAGIAFVTDHLHIIKDVGLVSDVFSPDVLRTVRSAIALGNVRYCTTGEPTRTDAQPFSVEVNGVRYAISHNGNIVNYVQMRKFLREQGEELVSRCDAEIILKLFAFFYRKKKDYFEAVRACMEMLEGAYSVSIMNERGEIITFRDPLGFKPLCYHYDGETFAVASESVALDINDLPMTRDVFPGECIYVSPNGNLHSEILIRAERKAHCMFEYVYFSRPDSVLDGRCVYDARVKFGEFLAKTYPVDADIVVPVPDTARPAAEGYSRESGIPVEEGLIKNRYVWRTFIMPKDAQRRLAVRLKLNAIRSVIEGKRLVLVDDSIVRGTTSGQIVSLLRSAGAKEVHVRITCPPIVAPCFYGIDMATHQELIAANHSVEEIREIIGADSLGYQTIENLVKAIGKRRDELCLGCLTDEYPTPMAQRLSRIAREKVKGRIRYWELESE